MLKRIVSSCRTRCSGKMMVMSIRCYQHAQPQNDDGERRRLRVGVIGMPNVGKSTLVNKLTGVNVLPVSKKADTTQRNTLAVLSEGNVQIEFEDSPGIQDMFKSKKVRGEFRSASLPQDCFSSADLCLVVADLSSRRVSSGFLQPEILLHLLNNKDTPAVLVLNKLDQITRPEQIFQIINNVTAGCVAGKSGIQTFNNALLEPISLPPVKEDVIEAEGAMKPYEELNIEAAFKERRSIKELRNVRGWPNFQEVFVVSAKRRENVSLLKNYILGKARPGAWKHGEEVITDCDSDDVLCDTMRAVLLNNLKNEVPYVTTVGLSDVRETDDEIMVVYTLTCKRPRHVAMVTREREVLCFGAKRRLEHIFSKHVAVEIAIV